MRATNREGGIEIELPGKGGGARAVALASNHQISFQTASIETTTRRDVGVSPATPRGVAERNGDRVAYRLGEHAEEWFVNGEDGLEQGWTLFPSFAASAESPDQRVQISVNFQGEGLHGIPEITPDGGRQFVRFVEDEGKEVFRYGSLVAYDADGAPLEAKMSYSAEPAPGHVTVTVNTAGARFPVTVDPVLSASRGTAQRQTIDSSPFSLREAGARLVFTAYSPSRSTSFLAPLLSDGSAVSSILPPGFFGGNIDRQRFIPWTDPGSGEERLLVWAKADEGAFNLWNFSISGGNPSQVTAFTDPFSSIKLFEEIPGEEPPAWIVARSVSSGSLPGSRLELFRTDGTPAGTLSLAPRDFAGPDGLLAFSEWLNGELYFVTYTNLEATLWKTDGTPQGTSFLSSGFDSPILKAVSGKLVITKQFFPVNGSYYGSELFLSDGTPSGTSLLKDIRPGGQGSSPSGFSNYREKLVFTATEDGVSRKVWITDGTSAGTISISPINAKLGTDPKITASESGNFFFVAGVLGSTGVFLWTSDGTANGTRVVRDDNYKMVRVSEKHEIVPLGEGVVFVGLASEPSGATPKELLCRSDGTPAGTRYLGIDWQIEDFGEFEKAGNQVFFVAENNLIGRELWVTDGSDTGTRPVADLNNSPPLLDGYEVNFAAVGDAAYFPSANLAAGTELWRLALGDTEPAMLADLSPGKASSLPCSFRTFPDFALFIAQTAGFGQELFSTLDPTVPLIESEPEDGEFEVSKSIADGSGAWMVTRHGGDPGTILRFTEGRPENTVAVEHFLESPNRHFPKLLGIAAGRLFFTRETSANGVELWSTPTSTRLDGVKPWSDEAVPGGASMVVDIRSGTANSEFREALVTGEILVFTNRLPSGIEELWRTNGTEAGTYRLIAPQSSGYFGLSLLNDGRINAIYYPRIYPGPLFWYATDGFLEGTVQHSGEEFWALPLSGDRLAGRTIYRGSGGPIQYSDGTGAITYEWKDPWKTGIDPRMSCHITRHGVWIQEWVAHENRSYTSPGRLWKVQHGGGIAQLIDEVPEGVFRNTITGMASTDSAFFRRIEAHLTSAFTAVPELPLAILTEVFTGGNGGSTDFVEIYDGGVGRTVLDGYSIAIYQGEPAKCSAVISLDNRSTDERGFLILGRDRIPAGIPDGPVAVALRIGAPPSLDEMMPEDLLGIVDAIILSPEDASADLLRLGNRSSGRVYRKQPAGGPSRHAHRSPSTELDPSELEAAPPTPGSLHTEILPDPDPNPDPNPNPNPDGGSGENPEPVGAAAVDLSSGRIGTDSMGGLPDVIAKQVRDGKRASIRWIVTNRGNSIDRFRIRSITSDGGMRIVHRSQDGGNATALLQSNRFITGEALSGMVAERFVTMVQFERQPRSSLPRALRLRAVMIRNSARSVRDVTAFDLLDFRVQSLR